MSTYTRGWHPRRGGFGECELSDDCVCLDWSRPGEGLLSSPGRRGKVSGFWTFGLRRLCNDGWS
jgi:hypothetical protein